MNEYYQYYLTLHTHPINRLLHFVGLWATIGYVLFTISAQLWLLLLLAPFVVYPFAWSGHYIFEKNKPAAFHNPVKAKIADWMMFKDILLGRLRIW
mgnify:CR=1 FL=1|jgi:hypothetical protein